MAQGEEEEGHDQERQRRDRRIDLQHQREHDDQRRGRGNEREDPVHDQVVDRIGVRVDAVDGVSCVACNVVVQAERLQVLE